MVVYVGGVGGGGGGVALIEKGNAGWVTVTYCT